MSYQRWLQVKRVKKLCNNDSSPKRWQDGDDPSYKYDYIWKTIFHIVNYVTKRAELNATTDETSFTTASPGEAGAGITFRLVEKPGVSKRGQTTVSFYALCVRLQAYNYRHKFH